MHQHSSTTLRKIAHEANMHRQYTVAVTFDLFGTPLVICRWGRIGASGQVREYPCGTIEEANAMAASVLAAKEKRGYGAGKGASTAPRQARPRKPAARLSRESAGPRQLWLVGVDASPAAFITRDPAPATASAATLLEITVQYDPGKAPICKASTPPEMAATTVVYDVDTTPAGPWPAPTPKRRPPPLLDKPLTAWDREQRIEKVLGACKVLGPIARGQLPASARRAPFGYHRSR